MENWQKAMGRNIFGLYGVIPTAAAFQAEGGISRAAIAVPSKLHHPRLPPIAESLARAVNSHNRLCADNYANTIHSNCLRKAASCC